MPSGIVQQQLCKCSITGCSLGSSCIELSFDQETQITPPEICGYNFCCWKYIDGNGNQATSTSVPLSVQVVPGYVDNFHLYIDGNDVKVSRKDIVGSDWCCTQVRYSTSSQPQSLTDGTLLVNETTKNQYCVNGYNLPVLSSGMYYITAFVVGTGGSIVNCGIISKCINVSVLTCCYGYTGNVQSITLDPGSYCVRLWGASGGNSCQHGCTGGKGGYSSGCINVSTRTTYYIYVGGMGSEGVDCARYGGWNGGGGIIASYSAGPASHMGTGGGATDISTVCSDVTADSCYRYVRTTASYNGRIIVAGGGGGGEYGTGGAGGGLNGCPATYGGTQSSAGTINVNNASSWVTLYAGGLGYGSSSTGGHCSHAKGAVGGGGYYGGGAIACNGDGAYGGGGSGYIGGVSNGITCAGDVSFPSPDGGSETGHCGNGCVQIDFKSIFLGVEVEVLAVAGGGGGGGGLHGSGGGGGAGGLFSGCCCLNPGSYCIEIGSGGAGAYTTQACNGGDTCGLGLYLYGGGGAGKGNYCNTSSAYTISAGSIGGSGGGGGGSMCGSGGGGGTCNSVYGKSGGSGWGCSSNCNCSGGGGGGGYASAGCAAKSPGCGGDGGLGLCSNITGTYCWYGAGGGGGGITYGGKSCGGGNGSQNSNTSCPATCYGSGGGGVGTNGGTGGQPGCQGVFIIRYLTACGYNITGGTKFTSGSYTIHCFTSSGTLVVS